MAKESRQKEAAEKMEALRRRLRQIEVDYQTPGSNYYASVERLIKWQQAAVQTIQAHLQEHESRKFQMAWEKVLIDHEINFTPLRDYLTVLLETIRAEPYLALVDDDASAQIPPEVSPKHIPPKTQRVLLIHGHDDANLQVLEELLTERDLEPVVLRREPAKGRTIIEKFEQVARTCAFAFALMTPDDQVRVDFGKPDVRDYYDHPAVQELRRLDQQYAQARPNVIFELGWMYGLLGRDRVCILFKEGTQIHSDLEGIERFVFKQSVIEVAPAIERELRASGLMTV